MWALVRPVVPVKESNAAEVAGAHGINMMPFWILSSVLVRSNHPFSMDNLAFHVVLHLFVK